jgi:WD40 repeat protein
VIKSIPIAARSLKISRFGTNRVFALTSDKMLKVYQVYGDGRLEIVNGSAAHIKPGNTLTFTADAALMATAGADGLIALWDGEAKEMIARVCSTCSLSYLQFGSTNVVVLLL